MTRSAIALGLMLVACAGPSGGPDELSVTVLSPNGGEVLTAGEPVELRWTWTAPVGAGGIDAGGLIADVELLDEDGAAIAIVRDWPETSLAWPPPGVAAPAPFRLRVTARTLAGGATASDTSDDDFTIAPPTGAVSLARDVQPIFTARCATRFCHEHATQAALLDLSAGAARAALVDMRSATTACNAHVRVRPGVPEQSYLLWKLAGSGPCLAGVRMPKDAPALPAAEVSLIRGWIAEGARAN